jgi:RND superfamily putative drug exporter
VGLDTSTGTDPIASYVPLMMFTVLFGLSMDYQVFLISKIEQHRAEGGSDRDAIRRGLASGARVIIAAALIMIAVFGSFILNGDPTVKQFGVGLSVGVALAALTVLAFAPAVLVLAGKGSWWVPAWLDRILPHMDVEGAGAQSSPQAVPASGANVARGK